MDLLTLIGDAEENFYQLGLLDRERAKEVHRDVKLMLSTPWKPVNKAIEEVAKLVLKNSNQKKSDRYTHLRSYADGLGLKFEDVAYVMLIPEIVSCMTKWAPGFIKGNLGCSSFFMRNEKSEVVHGRILDFPLQGSYDLYERAILYDLKGMPKTLGFSSAGIPYPSITLMTEDGMTLALHQKFTNVCNIDGLSIFELIFDLIKNANDKKSVLEYLRSHPSITTWCLYMSFKNGDVLAVDLMGKEIFANEFTIPDIGALYFCNHLENKELKQTEMLPTGFHQYNLMREEIANKKIAQFIKTKQNVKKNTDLEIIKMMATPIHQPLKTPGHYEHYLMDNLTPSSLTVVTLNPTAGVSNFIGGAAPKIYRDNVISITDCFNNPIQKNIVENPKGKTKDKKHSSPSNDYYHGIASLMKAQKGFDLYDPQSVYHNLQFAIDHLEHHAEKGVAEFYFLIAQYMFESHSKVLMTILHDFKKLEGHLPETLNDHCLLFIGRLERILQVANTLEEDKIIHPKLRAIYNL
ncbi:MAG: hypothetical protein Q7U04_05540, partial [Bacteriovorax sp.]|nr:hypothetical protein [Bacteriovorax sp.]